MLILKVIGAIMILISGYLFGRHIRDNMQNRISAISSIRKSLEYIDNKIIIENMYLEDVVMQCIEEIYGDEKLPEPFSDFIANIRENNMDTQNAWDRACEKYYTQCDYIKEDEKKYISQIGSLFTIVDKERQSESAKRIISGLNDIEKQSSDKVKKDGSLALKISMIIAVMLIVLIV